MWAIGESAAAGKRRSTIAFWAAICLTIPTMVAPLGRAAYAASGDTSSNRTNVLFCEDVRDTLAKSADMHEVKAIAFGNKARFRAADSSEGCTSLAALLKFAGSRVLITATTDQGESAHGQSAHLSAYFFRDSGATPRLVTVKRNFADGNGSWGNAGDITAARFGSDDGMMVSGGMSQQGYSSHSMDFYAFRNGGIMSLGTVPVGWENGGAETDDSKVVTITGRVETGLPQPDRVRVTYTRSAASGDDQSSVAIWHSQAGKFVLEAGSLPQELVAGFDLAADVVARNGTPVAPTDAAPIPAAGGKPSGIWSINDTGMATPSPDVAEAVKGDPNYPPICKLVGKEVLPSLSVHAKTWFVTTSNRCDAGGGVGPVWIVSVPSAGKASVVFSGFRHAIRIESTLHGEFHDVFVNGDADNPDSGEMYSFDGTIYRKSGS